MKTILFMMGSLLSMTSLADVNVVLTTGDTSISGYVIPYDGTFGAIAIGDCAGLFHVEFVDDNAIVSMGFLEQRCAEHAMDVTMKTTDYTSFMRGRSVPVRYRYDHIPTEQVGTVQLEDIVVAS